MSFLNQLEKEYFRRGSLLCISIDPRLEDLSKYCNHKQTVYSSLIEFVNYIISETSEYAIAYKFNIAYFEQFGSCGLRALHAICKQHRENGVLIIIDAKRGDIGTSSEAYSKALFEKLGADAVTISGYMGSDSVEPFIDSTAKSAFVLCKTSNPGSCELQDLVLENGQKVYERIATLCRSWNDNGNVGLVVGGTFPEDLYSIRNICPDQWLLVPGIGVQGGNLEKVLEYGITSFGGILVNVGRAITQSKDPRTAAEEYYDKIKSTIILKNRLH